MLKDVCGLMVVVLVLSACRSKDPEANIPTYIYVPEFTIDSSKSDMELFSHKISDVWVYLNDANQGAYELPALIPFSESGVNEIRLRPGIKNAGIATSRRPYPYYALTEENYNLIPGTIDTIFPTTFYNDRNQAITVAWEEGFESLGPSYEIKVGSDTGVTILNRTEHPDLVFKDNRTGVVYLDEPGVRFELISPTLENLPRTNVPIYLELNYKSNHNFVVGLYFNNKTEQIPIYIVKEKENWNKIYLDFSTYIQASSPGTNFNISIGFIRNSSESNVELYMDNIKLIHY